MARTPARAAAPARSTSASTSKSKAAKPLPRRPAPAPASRPQPGDDFAPLFAGLVALVDAHRAAASSAPARAMLAALDAILNLCRTYLAAPAGWRLVAGASEGGGLDLFAGLRLVGPEPPAPPSPAPAAVPWLPVEPGSIRPLGPFHSMLGSQTLMTIEQLGELSEALDCADGEARQLLKPGGGATVAGIRCDIKLAHDHLRFALSSLCELSAILTGEEAGRSPVAHAAALARLELLSGDDHARADYADWNRKRVLKAFRDDAV